MNQSLILFFSFLVSLIMIFLGIVIFMHNRQSATNRIFFIHSCIIALWSVANYFSLVATPNFILFWIRTVIFLAVPHVFLSFIFIENFPSESISIKRRHLFSTLLLMFLMMFLAASPFVFKTTEFIGGKVVPLVGQLMPTFAIILVLITLLTIILIIKKLIQSKNIIRRQWAAIGVGFFLAYVLLISLVFLRVVISKNTFFVPYSPLFVLPIFLGTAYAILRHNLFNIKAVAAEIITGILLLTSLIQVFSASSITNIIISGFVSVLLLIFGVFLIKSIIKEVTQRERLEIITNELQSANTRLKELDQQKTDFLSIAAHQLRTPMSIMNGYIELIKENAYGKVTNETKSILGNMDQSNQHLIKLVDEFLDITRIEQGRAKFDFANHDILPIIDGIVDELSTRAKERGLKISWERPKQPLVANIDEEKIRHVIYNFLDNAIKYSESGTIVVTAQEGMSEPSTVPSFYSSAPSAVERSDRPGIIVKVKDHGLGFGKVDEANFFQKFYRGANVKHINVNGSGLGLFVCRKFIENHGGHIWAHSAGLGRGSEFGFWIPIKQ